ncbi:hypothetical protein IGB42_04087 [Andreprevotia sp. IGB-42]|uniref:DUF4142 domain-containing protein n=1 Tax=Andreprevotia sp. IGB-42 TaxID=2497473 RepID=UPI00135808C1|nr:DUF4142 domain-containing protein [Andreprevotia sp. IGB-42]KAF0811469.1 hypothetical protein IGB42_04087 [Andreprevotia sp. IGB-42]
MHIARHHHHQRPHRVLAALLGAAIFITPALLNQAVAATPIAQAQAGLLQADSDFIIIAGHANAAEMAAAKLALHNSSNPAIKAFATQMLKDHATAQQKLAALATRKNQPAPATPSNEQNLALQRLQKLSGKAFDHAYVADQLSAHQEAVTLFSQQATLGADTDIMAFASDTLPTLLQHKAHIEKRSVSQQMASDPH